MEVVQEKHVNGLFVMKHFNCSNQEMIIDLGNTMIAANIPATSPAA